MKQAVGILAIFALLIGATVGYLVVNPAAFDFNDRPSPVVVVIDADVPGTKVFCQGELLGETPFELTWERLDALGFLDEDDLDPADPVRFDGDGLFLGPAEDFRITLQVPDAAAGEYLAVETPDGRRTKVAALGGPNRDGGPPRVVARLAPAATPEGLRFRISLPAHVDPAEPTFTVELVAENVGAKEIVGGQPEFAITCGDLDAAWNQRVQLEGQPLPEAWQRIRPGQAVTARYVMNTPDLTGHYAISATFGYRDQPAVTAASNTKLLQVK